ncbi:hypothetical protein ABZ208_20760 [Streptomyces sp. NPDC006208]|uniref:hypothetical protein n=1 Tax=Streptomyces sp. NPDC006208 TaxID=3156734 RepID=UPI0033A9A6FD
MSSTASSGASDALSADEQDMTRYTSLNDAARDLYVDRPGTARDRRLPTRSNERG